MVCRLPPPKHCRIISLQKPWPGGGNLLACCTILVQCKSFRCNTSEPPPMCCKQRTCAISKSFRCNTYKKPGRGGPSVLGPLHPLAHHRETVPEDQKCALTPHSATAPSPLPPPLPYLTTP